MLPSSARSMFILLALFAAASANAATGAEQNPPLVLNDRNGDMDISVTTAIAGSDLQFVAQFPKPLKSYFEDTNNVSVDFYIDTDNNAKTGDKEMPDARRGTDVIVIAVVRAPNKDVKTQEVFVTRGNSVVKTNARLKVDEKTMTVSVPLSDLKIQKGKQIRFVLGYDGELLEQTLRP